MTTVLMVSPNRRDCIRIDLDKADLPQEARAYGRGVWTVGFVDVCLLHGRRLVEVTPSNVGHLAQDLSIALKFFGSSLEQTDTDCRSPSSLEQYAHDQIRGAEPHQGWLSDVELSTLVQASEVFGAVVADGPFPNISTYSDERRRQARDNGFALLQAGSGGIHQLLERLMIERPGGTLHHKFGLVQNWLESTRAPGAKVIRRVVSEYVTLHCPVAKGALLMGEFVPERRVHTLRSAACQHGVTSTVVQALLIGAGLVDAALPRSDVDKMLFTADIVDGIVASGAKQLPFEKAIKRLQIPPAQFERLVAAGLIRAVKTVVGGRPRYDDDELSDFLVRLFAGAMKVSRRTSDMGGVYWIWKVTAGRPEIVASAILTRRLSWVGLSYPFGYRALLVNRAEVIELLRSVGGEFETQEAN